MKIGETTIFHKTRREIVWNVFSVVKHEVQAAGLKHL